MNSFKSLRMVSVVYGVVRMSSKCQVNSQDLTGRTCPLLLVTLRSTLTVEPCP